MNACNEAMGELTKDINDKILRMEGYVKSSVIDLEKNLINREYRVGVVFVFIRVKSVYSTDTYI